MDDLGGSGDGCEQRVVATHMGVGEAGGTLLGQTVGLADARVDIDGHRGVPRSRSRCPGSGQHLAGDLVDLTGVAPGEAAQERAKGGRGQHAMTQHRGGRPGPQDIAIVDGVATSEDRVDHRHGLVADMGMTGGAAQIDMGLEEILKTEVSRQGGRGDQPGIGDQTIVVEDHLNAVQGVRECAHREGALRLCMNVASITSILAAQGTFSRDGPVRQGLRFGGFGLNYDERHRAVEVISRSFVESAVNQVISKRMVKRQQMRWTPRGAHLLLQVRTRILNDDLVDDFHRWHPSFTHVDPDREELTAAA